MAYHLKHYTAFYGHFIPGSFFAGFGIFVLGLTFVRLRRAAASSSSAANDVGAAFCRTHVPEANFRLLRTSSIALMFCTVAGILVEGINCVEGGSSGRSFFCNEVHETLYFLFFLVGFIGLLEAHHLLPSDSIRAGTVVASACQVFLWDMHAQSKKVPVEGFIHFILALISLVTAVVMLASIYLPNRLELYIGGYAGILLQGIWLLSASLFLQGEHMAHEIGVHFVLEIACMTLLCVLCTAYLRWIKNNRVILANGAILNDRAYDKIDQTESTSSDEEDFGILPREERGACRVDLRLEEIS
jgi:hypothetical protein